MFGKTKHYLPVQDEAFAKAVYLIACGSQEIELYTDPGDDSVLNIRGHYNGRSKVLWRSRLIDGGFEMLPMKNRPQVSSYLHRQVATIHVAVMPQLRPKRSLFYINTLRENSRR